MTCFGKTILEQSYSGLTADFLICKYVGTRLSKQCIMNYNQNNSFVDNTLALGAQKNVKQLINAKDGKGDLIYKGDLNIRAKG